ncbi:superinfection immunity protein [Paraburkholderia heleia]|uniref:superinfection immunity protein n=1 Tax=Paraburkholderia heleia TaxID=634127 RepID=UPI0031D95A9F
MSDYQSSSSAEGSPSDPGGLLVIFVLLYFAPSIVAFRRMHHKRRAITGLNRLLGWSVLGWIVALLWALTGVQKEVPCNEQPRTHSTESRREGEDGFSLI